MRMGRTRIGFGITVGLVTALTVGVAVRGFARVNGGGTPATDCLIALEGVDAGAIANRVECSDCDPTCDTDGQANGSCTFHVAACVNVPGVTGCTPTALKKAKVTPASVRILAPTDLSGGSACGAFTDVVVKLKNRGKKAGKRKVRLNAATASTPRQKDIDDVFFVCLPSTGSCGPSTTTTVAPTTTTTSVSTTSTTAVSSSTTSTTTTTTTTTTTVAPTTSTTTTTTSSTTTTTVYGSPSRAFLTPGDLLD
jgi:hypothetical protein